MAIFNSFKFKTDVGIFATEKCKVTFALSTRIHVYSFTCISYPGFENFRVLYKSV